ncbi:MAG: phosphatidate cytidylyltransferase [Rhodospirillales bacterium]
MNAASAPVTPEQRLSGTSLRAVSALVLALPALLAVYFGPPWFTAMVLITAAAMGWEWSRMCGGDVKWLIAGALYIAIPSGALIWLRGEATPGMITIFWLFAVVWSADIAAYLSGRSIGGPKLAPSISPKKTWAGFVGGVTCATVVAGAFAVYWDEPPLSLALWGAVVAIASQAGDLLESGVKRHFGVKDSSALIPGHGGVLDRVDALVAGAVAIALLKYILGRSVMPWL